MEPVIGFLYDDFGDDDYDETKLPTTGLEYLRRVQQEAEECPDVVVADLRDKKFSTKQTVHVNEESGCVPAPQGIAPSLDWQQQQAADFANIRQSLANYKAKHSKTSMDAQLTLPKKNDRISWCRLCLGRQAVAKISHGKSIPDKDLVRPESQEDSVAHNAALEDGSLPLLSMLIQMNQATVQKLLEYHVNWLQEIGYSHIQGRWLYSLLACLEKPLLADSTALIRTVARQCAACRATQVPLTSETNNLVTSLNLIIALVARYFEQTDLADPG